MMMLACDVLEVGVMVGEEGETGDEAEKERLGMQECKECNEKGKLREDEKASDEFEDGVYGAGGDLKGGVRLVWWF